MSYLWLQPSGNIMKANTSCGLCKLAKKAVLSLIQLLSVLQRKRESALSNISFSIFFERKQCLSWKVCNLSLDSLTFDFGFLGSDLNQKWREKFRCWTFSLLLIRLFSFFNCLFANVQKFYASGFSFMLTRNRKLNSDERWNTCIFLCIYFNFWCFS